MKKLNLFWILLALLACKKSDDLGSVRLQRTEATDYNGNVLHTQYRYDNMGRITSILENRNSEPPVEVINITYNGNEAIMLSHPDFDPVLTQTKEVRLMLDASGKLLKKIELNHRVAKVFSTKPSEEFRHDTTIYEYDTNGLLKKTTGSRRDTLRSELGHTITRLFTSTVNYTNEGGNLVASDETITYPIKRIQAGVTTLDGGSSEYHHRYQYTNAFPNKADFKNAAVLNEYKLFAYEPALNSNYKNMPEKVVINNIDRDINGAVLFNINTTVEIVRAYDSKGFLSSISVPSNSFYRKINFYY